MKMNKAFLDIKNGKWILESDSMIAEANSLEELLANFQGSLNLNDFLGSLKNFQLIPSAIGNYWGIETPESSNISFIGYNHELSQLAVKFNNGGFYFYKDVPISIWREFLICESKGKYINNIKNKYNFVKL